MVLFRTFPVRWAIFKLLATGCLLSIHGPALGQKQTPIPPDGEVVRISAEIVQTDVAVFDRDGRFVENLKPEHFELKVNGKSKELSFFEQIVSGSASDDAQLAAARGQGPSRTTGSVAPLDRGRSFFFYLDDYHLSVGSITLVQELLINFINQHLGDNDEMAILTASGQLGFLQQLTGEKFVLRMAVERLKFRSFASPDTGRTPMTEASAFAIIQGDRRILDYFVEELLKELGGPRPTRPSAPGSKTRSNAEIAVQARARSIVDQSSALTSNTLLGLERLVNASAAVGWRKVIFFITDGFFLDGQTNSTTNLRRITEAAARSGTVIYSIEARGLISGIPDAATKVAFDPTGRTFTNDLTAIDRSQQPIHTLATQTGGRAFLNSNNLEDGLKEAIKETAVYYLLAWRPEAEEIRSNQYQAVEVSVKGRSDLRVQVRHGFLVGSRRERAEKSSNASANGRTTGNPLFDALHSLFRRKALPVSLAVGYTLGPENRATLTTSIEVDSDGSDYAGFWDESGAFDLEVLGSVIDDQGKAAGTLEQSLTVTKGALPARRIVYNHQFQLQPGLYQVRVAARHQRTSQVGSDMQWIEIPSVSGDTILLSSLFLGEMDSDAVRTGNLPVNGNRRFPRVSRLGFLTFLYNAARREGEPDVAVQVQIVREGQPVVTRPLVKIQQNLTAAVIPYSEDFGLGELLPGKYLLQVTAIDRVAKKTATRSARFTVH